MKPDARSSSGDNTDSVRDERIDALAADWLARREAGLTTEERAEFSEWLLADERHATAAERIERAWSRLKRPQIAGQAEALQAAVEAQVAQRSRRTRRRIAAVIALPLAAAAAIVFAFAPTWRAPVDAAPVATATVAATEWRRLPDGSQVELNAGAEIAVDFSAKRRAVRLVRGEAHFAVAKDPQRPFVVTAGGVAVRAVGTEFAVNLAAGDVDVLVTEGRVAVERAVEGAEAASALPMEKPAEAVLAFVDAGNRMSVPVAATPATAISPPSAVSAMQVQTALAWRSRRVEFTDVRLAEIVAHFNRRNTVQLQLATADCGEIRLSGVFAADDPEAFARLVQASAGLRGDYSTAGRIVLGR